jgi:hypothetical protein
VLVQDNPRRETSPAGEDLFGSEFDIYIYMFLDGLKGRRKAS